MSRAHYPDVSEDFPGGEIDGDKEPLAGSAAYSKEIVVKNLKEIVAAVLALLIVGSTVFWSIGAYFFVGNTGQMHDAKELLATMAGLAGVVLGYYFGRIPAEKHAGDMMKVVDHYMNQESGSAAGGDQSAESPKGTSDATHESTGSS